MASIIFFMAPGNGRARIDMSRVPRASFALLLALLPATATTIGAIVLRQIPGAADIIGVMLVMICIAVHKPAER